MKMLLGVIAIVWGAVNVVAPQVGWYVKDGWKFESAEPSDAALMAYRISGVVLVLAGFWIVFTG